MIDVDAAAVITKFALEIEKRALPLGKWPDDVSPLEHRNRNEAWLLLVKLQQFMKHVEESDLFLSRYTVAGDFGDDKEQERLARLVKQEDRGYSHTLEDLNQHLKDFAAAAKKDPDASKYGKELAKNKATRIADTAERKEAERVHRNERARERRAERNPKIQKKKD